MFKDRRQKVILELTKREYIFVRIRFASKFHIFQIRQWMFTIDVIPFSYQRPPVLFSTEIVLYLVNTLVSMESYSKVPLTLNSIPVKNNLKNVGTLNKINKRFLF